MLTGLVGFLVSINALNVLNSYVGRDFISAIESRNRAVFIEEAWLFVGVFALSTVAAVICSYLEQRLGLLWRNWQTRQVLESYLAHRAYYWIEDKGDLPNPDEPIAEDIRSFTRIGLIDHSTPENANTVNEALNIINTNDKEVVVKDVYRPARVQSYRCVTGAQLIDGLIDCSRIGGIYANCAHVLIGIERIVVLNLPLEHAFVRFGGVSFLRAARSEPSAQYLLRRVAID